MRLDPVFLVAPKPTPPSMPTRRAFLVAGATFTFGAAFGGACGYSIGAASAATKSEAQPELKADPDLPPTGDADLDELRRLAVKAPIEELVEKRLWFLRSLGALYRKDELLWQGLERLAMAVEQDTNFPDRSISARLIAQTIEFAEPAFRSRYAERAKQLRSTR